MRIFDALGAGLGEMRSFVPRLLGIFRQLFNEVIGFVFFAIALFFAFSANGLVQSARALDEDPSALGKMLLAGFFFFLFAWFGFSNFRRARRIQRDLSAED